MTGDDWAPVGGDERVRWRGQPRHRVLLQGVVAGVLAAVVVGGVAAWFVSAEGATLPVVAVGAGSLAVLAFAAPTLSVWLWRRTTRYLLTDAALYHRTGVVTVTVTELPLSSIQNTAYEQGVLGTLFGHGTVTVDTAGSEGTELRLRALDDPDFVHAQIAELVTRVGGSDADDIPGTLEQWQAVRAEVRGIRSALSDQ